MKKLLVFALVSASLSGLQAQKFTTKTGHISFFSTTPVENIEAHNYKAQSVLDLSKGTLDFAVLIKSFEFEKALMQQHFNEEGYMNSEKFPNAMFKGTIVDFGKMDLTKNGSYDVKVKGDLTMHGVTKNITADGKIHVKGGTYAVFSEFYVKLADFNISVPGGAAAKIAEKIKVTVDVQKYDAK
jgi:polyisoprenoid-binding protein YceI